MPMNVTRPSTLDVTINNPINVIYWGNAFTAGSWRILVLEDALVVETFVVVAFPDQNLTEASVTFIETLGFTEENPYIASVATDNRIDQAQPPGLNGDMVGRVITFDGFVWKNFLDEWVEKGRYQNSTSADRVEARMLNVIPPDPNDPQAFPPAPEEGIILGSVENVFGFSSLSTTDSAGISTNLPGMTIEPEETADFLLVSARDSFPRQILYEKSSEFGPTPYEKGDMQCSKGIDYRCNVTGTQTNGFAANLDKWDPIYPFVDLREAMSDQFGDIMVDQFGNIMMDTGPRQDAQ